VLVRMNADLAEIMAEARFHERACGRVERLTGRVQHFANNRGNSKIVPRSRFRLASFAVERSLAFLPTLFAFTRRPGAAAAGTFALQQTGPDAQGRVRSKRPVNARSYTHRLRFLMDSPRKRTNLLTKPLVVGFVERILTQIPKFGNRSRARGRPRPREIHALSHNQTKGTK
jgi:hypothetical protein